MTWNHRVVRHVCKGWAREDSRLEFQEVYYRVGGYMHGKPFLNGDNRRTMKETARRLLRCVDYPILKCKCDTTKRKGKR